MKNQNIVFTARYKWRAMKLRIALFSTAALCLASVPAQASRSVSLSAGPACTNGGTLDVTARGFGNAKTTLTIYATNTGGIPGTVVIGHATNSKNYAKASIEWYWGAQALSKTIVTIKVVGPAGNSAKGYLHYGLYDNFYVWGKCY